MIYYGNYYYKTMNNYKEIFTDANELYRAFRASIRESRWKSATQRYELNYLDELFSLRKELEADIYYPTPVTPFVLYDRGRKRLVSGIPVRDRIVRHVLCDSVLEPLITKKIIYNNCASMKGRGLSHARKRFMVHLQKYAHRHGNNGYILFGDFSKFFDNILHDEAFRQLSELTGHDPYLDTLLTRILDSFSPMVHPSDRDLVMAGPFNRLEYWETHRDEQNFIPVPKAANIGDQLSQLIGTYYPNQIDQYIKTVRGFKYYGRYMDDWYVISDSKKELEELTGEIRKIADRLGIHINPKKLKIVSLKTPFRYLQIKYSLTDTGRVIATINRKSIVRMRRKIKKLGAKNHLDHSIEGQFRNTFRGWMGNNYKMMSSNQRKALLRCYTEAFGVDIAIVNKHMIFIDTELS